MRTGSPHPAPRHTLPAAITVTLALALPAASATAAPAPRPRDTPVQLGSGDTLGRSIHLDHAARERADRFNQCQALARWDRLLNRIAAAVARLEAQAQARSNAPTHTLAEAPNP